MSESEDPREEEPRQPPAPLLPTLLQLLRLRASPADLPPSTAALAWLLAIDIAISAFFLLASGSESPIGLDIAIGLALQLLLPWLILTQLGKGARFLQTAIALIGVDVMLTAVLLPLASWGSQLANTNPTGPLTQLVSMVMLVAVIWMIMVFGHIYRCALDFPRLGGILVALGVMLTQVLVGQWLLGSPA